MYQKTFTTNEKILQKINPPWVRAPREAKVNIEFGFIPKRGLSTCTGDRFSDAQVGKADLVQVASSQLSSLVDPQEGGDVFPTRLLPGVTT